MEGGENGRRNGGPIVSRIGFPIADDGWRSRGSCCCIRYGLEASFVLMQASIPVAWFRQWRGEEQVPLPCLPHLDCSDRKSCQVLPLPDIASSNSAMASVADAVCEVWVRHCTWPPGLLPKARRSRNRRQRLKTAGSRNFLERFRPPLGLTQSSSYPRSSFVP